MKFISLTLYFMLVVHVIGCHKPNKTLRLADSRYDLENPRIIKLPNALDEISGIDYYSKDSSLFAIVDEDGLFYKIPLTPTSKIKSWRFDKKHDFEDVVRHDSLFYVLISNGDIETIRFTNNDSIYTSMTKFPGGDKKINEFETLFYDDKSGKVVIVCKKCEDDDKKTISAWDYDIGRKEYTKSTFSIDMVTVEGSLGEDKSRLKPSAAAVNPITGDIYILASVNHLLVITDRGGKIKQFFQLDPELYKQAEGITFTPKGDMIISNESHKTGNANILIIKNKKNGT